MRSQSITALLVDRWGNRCRGTCSGVLATCLTGGYFFPPYTVLVLDTIEGATTQSGRASSTER